jgi:hypothetical protein
LLNLLCGLAAVTILCSIFKRNIKDHAATLALAAVILLDTIFNQNLHSGRMDLVALFFVMCSILWVDRYKNERRYYHVALVGVFAAFAFLTTPRAAFLLPAPAVYFILSHGRHEGSRWLNTQIVNATAIALACFILPALATIEFTVGLQDYYHGMTSTTQNGTPMTSFISGSLLRESYENHVIVIMLVVVACTVKRVLKSELIISLIAGFIAFSIFVKETGPYSAMIMPFVYFIIIALVNPVKRNIRISVIAILLAANLGMFVLKTGIVLSSYEARNVESEYYSKLKSISPGSRVLTDYRLYYWCLANDIQFESYYPYNCSDDAYVEYMVNEYKPDYVFVKPAHVNFPIFKHPVFLSSYTPFAEIKIEDHTPGILEKFTRSFATIDSNFEGIVYKRTGTQP